MSHKPYSMASQVTDLSPGLGFRKGVVSNILVQLPQQVLLYCDPLSLMIPETQEKLKAQRKAESADAKTATPPFAEVMWLQTVTLAMGQPLDMFLSGSQVRWAMAHRVADLAFNMDYLTQS